MTGLISAILLLGMPVIIVFLNHVFRERKRKMQHEVVMKLAEKGQPVPPEQFLEGKEQKKKNDLSSGLTLISVGLGNSLAQYLSGNQEAAGWTLIPFFIGAARLISWKLEQGQKS